MSHITKVVFQTRLIPIAKPGIQFSVLAGLIVFLAVYFKGKMVFSAQMLEAVLIFEGVVLPFNLLIMFSGNYCKVEVCKEGIYSRAPFSSLSQLKFLPWDQMKKRSFTSILGYPYCLIQSNDQRKRLWIPIEITQRKAFHSAVAEKAGGAHPLSTTLTKGDLNAHSALYRI